MNIIHEYVRGGPYVLYMNNARYIHIMQMTH